ncbi:alpha-1,2-mannosidase [Mucilaginibacter mali]|uniref:Alpha-1,2-mannosidase n=2 Tax=Mucilaginibacter mali TaxID=2740462 RepID=A0A7D4QYS2_9SPHI|nr:alpha-1,2-mannosidase [Mucilaginibacter mali]
MIVESLKGPITPNELAAFKAHIAAVNVPDHNDGNIWVYGNPGKIIEACGLMYEATGDKAILDRMLYYCDAALAGRNDLASEKDGGQRPTWSGKIDPVWPSSKAGVKPASAGVAVGSVLAHILYGAKVILANPTIWNETVGSGNPHSFGATYKERALKYVKECDYVADSWMLPTFVRADKKFYFPGPPNDYKPGEAVPWNQICMFTNGLVRLAECHDLLKDAPEKSKLYTDLVKVNFDWFKSTVVHGTSAAGTPVWKFKYALISRMEDTNHFAYDSEGMYLAYINGKCGVTLQDMTIMANTYFDVVLTTVKDGKFAGNVDGSTGTGHAGGDNYVRDEYIYLADIRKDQFNKVGEIEQAAKKIAVSPQITARLLWLKNKRFKAGM